MAEEEASYDLISAATARALQVRLAAAQRDGRVPSVVAAVARRGEPVWFGAAGLVNGQPPTDAVQYRIGSITKTMVAVLVLRMLERGDIALDDEIGGHLPDAPAPTSTIHQLLTHTSGIASETPPPWWERTDGARRPELIDVLPEEPLRHAPGRMHHYSNPGFALLGALVAAKSGRPWFDVLTEDVLHPIGLRRTTYLPVPPHAQGFAVHPWADVVLPEPAHDHGLLAPAGQIWSTPGDLCRLGVFLAGDGTAADGAVILRPETLELMRTPAVAPGDPLWVGSYGLGVQHLRFDDRVYFGHTGSMPGFLAMMMSSIEDGLTVSMQSNAWSALAARSLTGDLFDIVRNREPTMPHAWAPVSTAVDRHAYELVGPWYWGAVAMAITLCADGLLHLAGISGGGRAARFRRVGDGRWVGLNGYYHGEVLDVRRDDAGVITHLDLGSFVFTRAPYAPGDVVPDGLGLGDWDMG